MVNYISSPRYLRSFTIGSPMIYFILNKWIVKDYLLVASRFGQCKFIIIFTFRILERENKIIVTFFSVANGFNSKLPPKFENQRLRIQVEENVELSADDPKHYRGYNSDLHKLFYCNEVLIS